MSSFVETKAMEQLTKSPMEFVEYPLVVLVQWAWPGAQRPAYAAQTGPDPPAPVWVWGGPGRLHRG